MVNDLATVNIDAYFEIIGGQGLEIKGSPPPAVFMEVARFLKELDNTVAYAWGDLLNSIPPKYGQTYNRICAISGLSESRLANLKSMCKRIPPHRRPKELTPSHVMVVCDYRIPPEAEDRLLAACVASAETIGGPWTVSKFREYVLQEMALAAPPPQLTKQDVEEENMMLRRDVDIVAKGLAEKTDVLARVSSALHDIYESGGVDETVAETIEVIIKQVDESMADSPTMFGINGHWEVKKDGYGVAVFFIEHTDIGEQRYDISKACPEQALADLARRLGYGGVL